VSISLPGRLLAAAIAELPLRPTDVAELHEHLDEVTSRALWHRVPGALAHRLRDLDLHVPERLHRAEMAAGLARLRTLEDLAFAQGVLDRAGIENLVFKGPVLTTIAYRDRFERPAADLDMLVPQAALREAVAELVDAGAILLDRNWAFMRKRLIGEMHLILPRGTGLDLHWSLLVNSELRSCFAPDSEGLFARARSVRLGDVDSRTFDPPSTLVYSCLHACISGGYQLVWLKDIEQLVLNDQPDWSEVADVADRWACRLQVAALLDRTSTFLGLELDRDIVEQLAPSRPFRYVMSLVDRRSPTPDLKREESFVRLTTRSIGPTLSTSLRWFFSRSLSVGRRRLLHGDFEDPLILLQKDGTPDDRLAYFDQVSRHP
jgi:hypothetical protein